MNQSRAFAKTVALAEDRGMPEDPESSLGLAHLRDMLARVESTQMSPSKLGRWLGWAQAAVVAAGVADLEEMKLLNLSEADDEGDDPESLRRAYEELKAEYAAYREQMRTGNPPPSDEGV